MEDPNYDPQKDPQFLSRLYGVEGLAKLATLTTEFLSRLYGVEVNEREGVQGFKFLSRLYGVEG